LTGLTDGAEFHQGVIVTSGVESYRHVLGIVLVGEEEASQQESLGIEQGIGRSVGTDVGGYLQFPSFVTGFRILLL